MTACASWPIHVLVVISAAVGATGCTLERSSDTSDTDDPRACEASGQCEEADTTSEAQSLTDLPRNGLAPSAIDRETLAAQGTQDLLRAIMNGGLKNQATLNTSNREWIRTYSDVRDLMKYVVSCALGPNDYMDPHVYTSTGGWVLWPGALGLCSATSGGAFGNWAYAPPTPACLEIVSSCVLARVNALQKKVVISMRGESNALTPLLQRVPVVEEYREKTIEGNAIPIASFNPTCAPGQAGLGPLRDCAWKGRYVGLCGPGSTVTLQTASAMVRVCKGIHGCNQNSGDPPWYMGIISSVDVSNNTMMFTCPSNDVSPTARSYFAVMLASSTPGTSLDPTVDVTASGTSVSYPSSEQEVFMYREGAFFGNIFDAVNSRYPMNNPNINMLVGYQYACYSELWNDGVAHATDRLCAGPNSPCFENAPERCVNPCSIPTGSTPPIYTPCSTATPSPRTWTHPITVYLNHPCDLARDFTSCKVTLPNTLAAH